MNNGRTTADRERLGILAKSFETDDTRRVLMTSLSDGKWHSIHQLGRQIRNINRSMGVVRIGIILSDIQMEVGNDFIECNESGEIAEWRVNPAYLEVLQSMLQK